mmetsp:Transcript_8500/g.10248  ORF Transcript_8500/g.10248 Transcript_8500/m.10248 type:complete len:85 (+) Transcript_8500:130-384(+)
MSMARKLAPTGACLLQTLTILQKKGNLQCHHEGCGGDGTAFQLPMGLHKRKVMQAKAQWLVVQSPQLSPSQAYAEASARVAPTV